MPVTHVRGRADTPSGLTAEEFIQEYNHIVRAVIVRYVPRDLGDIEDLTQEIWRQFLEGQNGVPYIQIYDPTKASPKTFMWEFARVRCMQFLSRSTRTPTANAYSIRNQPEDGFQVGVVDPETTAALGFDEAPDIEFRDLVARAQAAVFKQRIRGRRDLRWVWYNLLQGFRQDQIAAEMELSEGTISICMDKIREIPEVQELRDWAIEKGILMDTSLLDELEPRGRGA